MKELGEFNREMVQRLPLPMAQLYRRARNAKIALDRHLTAFFLWEVAIKLIGTVSIVVYAEQDEFDPRVVERLRSLARPSLGHWWEFTRLLVPILAESGDPGFQDVGNLLFSRVRDDMPCAAGLSAALNEEASGAHRICRTVRLPELFEGLIAYRNRALSHGAIGQRPQEFYEGMATALLKGASEVFERLDVLAGWRLMYLSDSRRKPAGGWLHDSMDLKGEVPERVEPIESPDALGELPPVDGLYLVRSHSRGALALRTLRPLMVYEPDGNKVFFRNGSRRRQHAEYLCYTTGELQDRPDMEGERRRLLVSALDPVPNGSQSHTAAAQETRTVGTGVTQRAFHSTSVPFATDQAFSSETVVLLYPAPIAIAYRRFCLEAHPRSRLTALYCVLEAIVRYLVTLGASDLFHCLAESGVDSAERLKAADFDFLRNSKPMSLGRWVSTLRETARALSATGLGDGVIPELPGVCEPGGSFDAGLLHTLVKQRNDDEHPDAYIPESEDECAKVLKAYRPLLDQALRQIGFVCHYPLGFLSPFPELQTPAGQRAHHLHCCMGASIGATSRALDVLTFVELQEETPFVVTPEGCRLLYLWPLLLERRSHYTGQRTLWVFEEIPDKKWPFLTKIRSAAVDVREDFCSELHPEPRANHAWLLERLRAMPPAPEVPADLRLAEKLLPTRGGKLIGRELGPNRLLSVIAIGGFGTIYGAETNDGKRVAVKVIESRPSGAQRLRFEQEIDKLRRAAHHPGVIRCFGQGNVDIDGRLYPWYSMEFALGGDLRSRIDERNGLLKGRIPWSESDVRQQICNEFIEILDAVAHVHDLDIVHRDIKPGNVLIMEDGGLRLSDFGLVKNLNPTDKTLRLGPARSTGGGIGTPGYMPPEQAFGQEVGKTADVYSLGIMLGELVLGTRPDPQFPLGHRVGSTLQSWKSQQRKSLQQLPERLRLLIERCTDYAPENRPKDAQALLKEFRGLIDRGND
jgi:hypothetical protein